MKRSLFLVFFLLTLIARLYAITVNNPVHPPQQTGVIATYARCKEQTNSTN